MSWRRPNRAVASGVVRFLVVVPEFSGMSGGALWEDLKVGAGHLRAWQRIALVTDIHWMDQMTTLFGTMAPGQIKRFPLARRDQAIAWLTACLRSGYRSERAASRRPARADRSTGMATGST